jgi:hypothetical protein
MKVVSVYKERKAKMNYENNILLKKIIEIEQKPSLYNISKLAKKECPAFEKSKKNYKSKFLKSQLETQNYVIINNLDVV